MSNEEAERIWAAANTHITSPSDSAGKYWGGRLPGTTEYVRADLAAKPVAVTEALTDDQIMEIIKQVAPWKTEPQLNDLLTYEKSPPLFPQATYDVPSYRATKFVRAVEAALAAQQQAAVEPDKAVARSFQMGDRVTKKNGSSWTGSVVGFYSTKLTPIGYAVESDTESGSVQIYPEAALSHAPPSSETDIDRILDAVNDQLIDADVDFPAGREAGPRISYDDAAMRTAIADALRDRGIAK